MNRIKKIFSIAILSIAVCTAAIADEVDYDNANAILTKYCEGCHNADDPNGKFALDTFSGLQRGGERGNALTPGSAVSSRMIQMMQNKLDPKMPPDGETGPTEAEIQLLVDWIDGGAPGPDGESELPTTLNTPRIESVTSQKPVTALAYSADQQLIAIGRFEHLEVRNLKEDSRPVVFEDLPGKITAIKFSANGTRLFVSTGVSGLYGEAVEIELATGRSRHFRGHRDMAYSVSTNRDETMLVTSGYDRKAVVWNLASTQPLAAAALDGQRDENSATTAAPKKLAELLGHNGAVFEAIFDPTSKVVITASADATVKIWRTLDGERLDTRGEPLKEQYTVDISPDGKWIVAGGEDNRIRKWQLVSTETAMINPLMISRFAHESAIQKLQYHPGGKWIVSVSRDQNIKIWDADTLREAFVFPKQTANVQALAVAQSQLAVGRMDGSLQFFDWPDLQLSSEIANATNSSGASSSEIFAESLELQTCAEQEPNDELVDALSVTVPFKVSGTIDAADRTDVDTVKFSASAGQQWVMEIKAAADKSPLDSQIAVLDHEGKPVPRVLLQAVRDSYFTFRGKDSTENGDFRIQNWEEMQIGQLLYCNGEVVRLYHYPRGPDSGFNVFPNFGKRQTLFDTTPMAHALNEPCYIVEPFEPDAELVESGLPSFLINYENDDDAEQELDSDSRLTFTAPADGEYYVRIKDSRGFQGGEFKYELTVRQPRPGFSIRRLIGENPKLAKGTYAKFGIEIDRIDGFEGPVEVSVEAVPDGFSVAGSTTVEAGQLRAWMVLYAKAGATDVPENAPEPTVVATAIMGEREIRHEQSLGKISLEPEVQLKVELFGNVDAETKIPVIEIRPGSTTSTKLKVDRVTHKDRINFGKENAGINFPFGVYVDNIGLNGVLLPPHETERTIFLTAETFVQPCQRLVFLEAEEAGKPSSNPVILRVLDR